MDYSSGGDAAAASAIWGMLCCYYVVIFLLVAFYIAGMWKIFTKAGQPGWAAIVPIYNLYVVTQITGREVWWMFVYWLVPIFGPIMLCVDIAKSFGKDMGYAIGMILLGFIFFPMLGFGKSQYVGPAYSTGGGGYTPPPPTYQPPAPPAPPAPPTYQPPAPPAPPAE